MRKQLDPRLRRITEGPLKSTDSYGFNGAFRVTGPKGKLNVIISDGDGWEHASVSPTKADRIPTWEEMSFIKELLWEDEEAVVQYHPPKSRYVNNHPYVLHLWRPMNEPFPLPPVWMVGKPGLRVTSTIPVKGGLIIKGFQEKNK